MSWIKRHRWLSAFLIAAVLLLGWRQYDRHFTPERWAETDISHRGKLVDSLLKQYGGLVGMTQAEVEELLGADTDEMQVQETFYPDRSSEKTPMLVYAAGGRPWAMFPEYLYVYLKDGRVTEAKIVAD